MLFYLLLFIILLLSALSTLFYASFLIFGKQRDFHVKPSDFLSTKLDKSTLDFIESEKPKKTGLVYGVVGGSGFLGRHLIRALLERGETKIYNFDLVKDSTKFSYSDLDDRIKFCKVDVRSRSSILEAFKAADHIDVVYSVFAAIRPHNFLSADLHLSWEVNVIGTENLIAVLKDLGIKMLIQTSTSNVTLGYDRLNTFNGTEDIGYTKHPFNHYCLTKSKAEKLVLKSNCEELKTGSIRPCTYIYGMGDAFSTSILSGNKIINPSFNKNVVADYVYVENVVHGHLLLEEKLRTEWNLVGGKAFNISNEEPMSDEEFTSILTSFDKTLNWRGYVPPLLLWLVTLIFTFKGLFNSKSSTIILNYPVFLLCNNSNTYR
ncbi:hypothetical protein HK099_008105 [Clydaea vesicula]|uniref:3-beta hydroxysteroid dehydrogenase/isomerase domain-containing protein n=1 Tax=Clydaea vesicula TaxID=447962 RepID=A0AAD5U0I0_9FUNG|nr:hypothetical protein HK099_008105 [Clydaea vesicula]